MQQLLAAVPEAKKVLTRIFLGLTSELEKDLGPLFQLSQTKGDPNQVIKVFGGTVEVHPEIVKAFSTYQETRDIGRAVDHINSPEAFGQLYSWVTGKQRGSASQSALVRCRHCAGFGLYEDVVRDNNLFRCKHCRSFFLAEPQ